MADMLVKLYDIEDTPELFSALEKTGVRIVKALSPDKSEVLQFIRDAFSEGWASECEAAFANHPPTIFIAVMDKKVIGFCAYDATAKGYFGPMGVAAAHRKKGIGKALMMKALLSMREFGYGYAVIGWAAKAAVPFYERHVGATIIENSYPGVYSRMIRYEKPAD